MKRVLLVIGGGIAAYKCLLLIRLLKARGIEVRCVLTKSAAEFVTPLSLGALSGDKVYGELFSLTDEQEMGHIELSRSADLVVVAPATADLMAKAANGLANDLASTVLLATDKPVLMAPAMNVRMWHHPATQRNLKALQVDGIEMIGPDEGDMACGEYGLGRMAEPEAIFAAILAKLEIPTEPDPHRAVSYQPLAGKKILVTAGPTFEPIDPVRGITNRSSGKQGYALAAALADLGAKVVLVSGPVALDCPKGVQRVWIETAIQMEAAVKAQLPVDAAVCVAAVADWRPVSSADRKMKKAANQGPPALELTENPDILRGLSQPGPERPSLVIGFAAETHDVEAHARQKLERKGCDAIIANDVSGQSEAGQVFGGDRNAVLIVSKTGTIKLAEASKTAIAAKIATYIQDHLLETV